MNEFLSIQCNGKPNLKKYFLSHVIRTNKWKHVINDSLNINDKLDKKQNVIEYIRSHGSLRNLGTNSAERNRILGQKTTVSELVIKQAILEEQLQTDT